MKILYINSLDRRYGSTYRSRQIIKALISLRHDVVYVESNLSEKVCDQTVSIIQNDSLWGYVLATWKRMQLARRQEYDILFVQKFIPLVVPCLFVAKLKGKRCIVDWDDLDYCYQRNLFKKIAIFLSETIFPYFADCITTHSNRLVRYAHQKGIRRVELVNQVVDLPEKEMNKEREGQLKKHIGAEGKKVLSFLGTLTWGGAGDLDIIINAVSRIVRERKDAFFLIIGGGPLEGYFSCLLQKLGLEESSYVTGIIHQNEVAQYLNISDIGLIFMRDNAGNRMRVSLKALEYLRSGIPVVGHLVGESKERFASNCILCGENAEDFSRKIIEVLNLDCRVSPLKPFETLQVYEFDNLKESLKKVF